MCHSLARVDTPTHSCLAACLFSCVQVAALQLKLHELHATDVNIFRCVCLCWGRWRLSCSSQLRSAEKQPWLISRQPVAVSA